MAEFRIGNITVTGTSKSDVISQAIAAYAEQSGLDLAGLKAWATEDINRQAQAEVIRQGILTNQLFFTANVADIGFLVTEWRSEGRPVEPDEVKYYRAHREAAAYAETSDPTMTPAKMLTVWETQWNWMRHAFADLNYTRRVALEKIKLAQDSSEIASALADIEW